jgi:NADH-quinone oxidoreductase subunit E
VTAQETIDLRPAQSVLDEMGPVDRGALIPLLQKLQEAYGYLPPPMLLEVSKLTRIPASQIYGVATFYAQFHLEPHGRHTVRVCRGTACHVRGSGKILEEARDALGVAEGETTDDMLFSLETVACLGSCAMAPMMVIDKTYYGRLTPSEARKIIEQHHEEAQS